MKFSLYPLSQKIDTSRSQASNIVRELKSIHHQAHEIKSELKDLNKASLKDNSPYLTDRSYFDESRIKGSQKELSWKESVPQRETLQMPEHNLKKLNII
jgi:hypothetical protein